jgi:hypothetical protein
MGFAAAFACVDAMIRLAAKARALGRWVEVDATLEDMNIESQSSKLDVWKDYSIQVRYTYSYCGQQFRGDKVSVLETMKGMGGSYPASLRKRLSEQYASRRPMKAWVDPADPRQSFLVKISLTKQMLMFTAGLIFVALIIAGFCLGFLSFAPIPVLAQLEGLAAGVALYLFWRFVSWQ